MRPTAVSHLHPLKIECRPVAYRCSFSTTRTMARGRFRHFAFCLSRLLSHAISTPHYSRIGDGEHRQLLLLLPMERCRRSNNEHRCAVLCRENFVKNGVASAAVVISAVCPTAIQLLLARRTAFVLQWTSRRRHSPSICLYSPLAQQPEIQSPAWGWLLLHSVSSPFAQTTSGRPSNAYSRPILG